MIASSSSASSIKKPSVSNLLTHSDRIAITRHHFEEKGYRVHSGLQFGCELVLYADHPGKVHSDFCVHIVENDGKIDWMTMQRLTRCMPDLHKTLIIVHVLVADESNTAATATNKEKNYIVKELAIATEHAPFRHDKANTICQKVGMQTK